MPVLNAITKTQLSIFNCGICKNMMTINEQFVSLNLRYGIGNVNLMVDCKNCGCTSYLDNVSALPLVNAYFRYKNPEMQNTLTTDNCINVLRDYIVFTKTLEGL